MYFLCNLRCFLASRCYSTVPDSFYLDILAKNSLQNPKLNTIRDNLGARKKKIRVGRGTGSGCGKTSRRGHKGRKSRQGGVVAVGFEGGQTPLYKHMKKHGFNNTMFTRHYAPLNLSKLEYWVNSGRLPANEKITIKHLIDSGCIGRLRGNQVGVKLLAEGSESFKTKIILEVSQASAEARAAIEQHGGSVKLVHNDAVSLRAHLKPEKYEPYTSRRLPYTQSPRKHLNRRLGTPMEQADQLPHYKNFDNQSASNTQNKVYELIEKHMDAEKNANSDLKYIVSSEKWQMIKSLKNLQRNQLSTGRNFKNARANKTL